MKLKIGIFINQTAGSAFCRVFHHTLLRRRFEGELEFPDGADDTAILNEVFRRFNVEFPAGYAGPSLSVADVVTIAGARSYEVLSFGFGPLAAVVDGEEHLVELPEPKLSEIKAWRTRAHGEGRPSSREDFYRAHNICPSCRGRNSLSGDPADPCPRCGGTGEFPATEGERVMQGLRNLTSSIKSAAAREG